MWVYEIDEDEDNIADIVEMIEENKNTDFENHCEIPDSVFSELSKGSSEAEPNI